MIRSVRPPFLARKYYPDLVWRVNTFEKVLYLTFDDGPTPGVTEGVLDELRKHNAKGTFFCLGKNVRKYPEIFQRIMDEGHAAGNHTENHLNGWQSSRENYLSDIQKCAETVCSDLFRPPYGRITKSQIKALKQNYKLIMWDVLSWDFDSGIPASRVLRNVCAQCRPGSIVVFHDSRKAEQHVLQVLPKALRFFEKKGYRFGKLEL
ncbi:MAG: polysaccharide deacetylase family protein [Bacteroidia bacterium]|nr:polysaccharide deacetylase family protein [Bacteroidia bacterium]